MSTTGVGARTRRAGETKTADVAEPGSAIGTLNEGDLHVQLKEWCRRPGDRLEQEVDGYVVDLVRDDLLIEVQTGGLAPIRRKLDALSAARDVRLVTPVALTRRIVRLSAEGQILSARRSPKRGRLADVFARLVSCPELLRRPTVELEVVLTHEEERRVHRPGSVYRRRGWTVVGRALLDVEESVRIAGVDHVLELLPTDLPDVFDTSELAAAAGVERRLARQIAYCLRGMGGCAQVGRRGRAALYALTR